MIKKSVKARVLTFVLILCMLTAMLPLASLTALAEIAPGATLNMTEPVAGQTASFDLTFAENNYTSESALYWTESKREPSSFDEVDKMQWYADGDSLVFEEGKYYTAIFEGVLANGISTPSTANGFKATFNGKAATFVDVTWAGVIYTYCVFFVPGEAAAPLNRLTATNIVPPVADAIASFDITVAESDYLEEYFLVWCEMDERPYTFDDVDNAEWYFSMDSLTFAAGKYYVALVIADLTDAYYVPINPQKVTATINDKKATFVDTGSEDCLYSYSVFYLPTGSEIWGDVNMNGKVEPADALLALQAATNKVSLTASAATLSDVDSTYGISPNDALCILQYTTMKLYSFPVENR